MRNDYERFEMITNDCQSFVIIRIVHNHFESFTWNHSLRLFYTLKNDYERIEIPLTTTLCGLFISHSISRLCLCNWSVHHRIWRFMQSFQLGRVSDWTKHLLSCCQIIGNVLLFEYIQLHYCRRGNWYVELLQRIYIMDENLCVTSRSSQYHLVELHYDLHRRSFEQ